MRTGFPLLTSVWLAACVFHAETFEFSKVVILYSSTGRAPGGDVRASSALLERTWNQLCHSEGRICQGKGSYIASLQLFPHNSAIGFKRVDHDTGPDNGTVRFAVFLCDENETCKLDRYY